MQMAPPPGWPPAGPTAPADIEVAGTSDFLSIVSMQTTGGHVWDAARRLLEYIMSEHALAGCSSLLELGAGTGWLGMSLALALPGLTRVALTEMELGNACAWLGHNVERNRHRLAGAGADQLVCVEVSPFDWACAAHGLPPGLDRRWDAVIGSDLIYNAAGAAMLPMVLRAAVTAGGAAGGAAGQLPPRILYAHTRYRFEHLDRDFFSQCTTLGLALRRVWPSEAARPPSPPPFTELFPEQYVAIFSVTLAVTEAGGPASEGQAACGR